MDEPFLFLPDVSLQTMKTLLTLLHNGTVNVPKTYVFIMYRTRAYINRGLYIFYPMFLKKRIIGQK